MRSAALVLVLLLATGLAGCSGGGGSAGPADPTSGGSTDGPGTGGTSPTGGSGEDPDPTKEGTGCSSDDPVFHTHDNWGIRSFYALYGGTLEIGSNPRAESSIGLNGATIGFVTFDTETDGSNDGDTDKTDIVMQGTKDITVRLDWTDSGIPGLKFFFKHANSPEFIALGAMENGIDYTIVLKERWADMAHQDLVSRWRFYVEAYDPEQETSPYPVHVAQGSFDVFMEIHKGDAGQIDPPHPSFYCESKVRYGGEINKTLSQSVVVTVDAGTEGVPREQVAQGTVLDGWAPDPPHFIAWQTNEVRVTLNYTYTGQATNVPRAMGLKYHAADSLTYQYPEPETEEAGSAFYRIPITEKMTDSPYAFSTDWEFGVYPILNNEEEQGDWTGAVEIDIWTASV